MTNHGTLSDAALATLKQANLTLDGTGTLSISQITTFTAGTLSLTAGTEAYTGLTDADGSSLEASGGATLSFPALASYAGGVDYTTVLDASGSGSTCYFPSSRRSRRTRPPIARESRSRPWPAVKPSCRL